MARFFVTGSSDGLGLATAKHLVAQGRQVVLHARNADRARDATAGCPRCDAVLTAPGKSGLPSLFTVDTLAPYMRTCLMARPKRLVFISSPLHSGGQHNLGGTEGGRDIRDSHYGDSKVHVMMLTKASARRWPDVQCSTAAPGWVPTKVGGESAPDRLEDAVDTFAMVALDEGPSPSQSYFEYFKEQKPIAVAGDVALQDQLLAELSRRSGVPVPEEQ
ncbi:hypothetical protein B0T26DRAFT_744139 [Lasiosphaeria miniovina]|uniref:Uncharacterized protein n=1 Tax=Lasiosphaeria miniovina TaxID=1954250 RepID=A0AA40DH58_9PEZI|nr:uncharacterized protein B0T26DRAFT_744139 [Lasiosphaeria miniovina]KAK0702965.1 hypothetical protein B0T26DRAFT_744139 [Lasiosphaeria miniovina]